MKRVNVDDIVGVSEIARELNVSAADGRQLGESVHELSDAGDGAGDGSGVQSSCGAGLVRRARHAEEVTHPHRGRTL